MILEHADNPVPDSREKLFLFTVDIDWIPGSESGLELLAEYCSGRGVPLNLFVTGRWAMQNAALLRQMAAFGDIGSHGWEHGLDPLENYRHSTATAQKHWITLSTEAIGNACGVRPRAFRAPFLAICETTLTILENLDYRLDSSVPARRFDFGHGTVNYTRYFRAPLFPYHPCRNNLAHRGDSAVLEAPPSACVIPLNMKALLKFGPRYLGFLASRVASRTPVLVFYAHAYVFVEPSKLTFHPSRSRWYSWASPKHIKLLSGFIDYILAPGCRPARLSELMASFGPDRQ